MHPKYLTYSLEELLENKNFVSWVLRGHKNNEWEKFIENEPGFNPKAKKAREIILLLRDTYEVLDEDSILEMWQNIEKSDELHRQKARKIKLRKMFSRAASILLLISLGTFGYFYLNKKKVAYQFASSQSIAQSNNARLVLSGGDEIALTGNNSTLALSNNNQLTINNDSTIDLSQNETKEKVQMNEVVIPYGKRSELLLADGTKVWLNAGSRLAFPSNFTKKTREVFLEGEAYFEVSENKAQPFIVNAAEVNIKVLGTRFNVSAYPTNQYIETVLLEGIVALSNPKTFGFGKNETLLAPNQKASFNKGSNEFAVDNESDMDMYVAWTYGWLRYNRESLGTVLQKVGMYYNVKIQLSANYPGDDAITGKLDLKESLDTVMLVLADACDFEYRISENKVIVEKKLKELQRR